MAPSLKRTHALLENARELYPEIILAMSGGKDSIACIELAIDHWKPEEIHCYFMYLIPGISLEQDKLKRIERRYGVKIRQYPHPELQKMLRAGYLTVKRVPFRRNLKYSDYPTLLRNITGAKLLMQGQRMDESLQRRGMIKSTTGGTGLDTRLHKVFPVFDWNAKSIYAFLRQRKAIDFVVQTGHGDTSGVSLGASFLMWLEENSPEDFERACGIFPLARAKVMRERQRLAEGLHVMKTTHEVVKHSKNGEQ